MLIEINLLIAVNSLEQTRSAVINIFKMVDLAGKDGIVSEFSPGVFCQVYLFPLQFSSLTCCQVECDKRCIVCLNFFVRYIPTLLFRELLSIIFSSVYIPWHNSLIFRVLSL